MEDWNIELNSQYLGYRNQYPNHPNNQYILMLGLSGTCKYHKYYIGSIPHS